MIESILVVLSRPVDGRHEEFNDWYTHIHLRDALRFRGSIAVQRFFAPREQAGPLSDGWSWDYLALYEVFDTQLFTQAHRDAADTVWMEIAEAFDASDLNDFYYSPLAWRQMIRDEPHRGGVIMEQFNAAPGKDAELVAWYLDEQFEASLRRPEVYAGALLPVRAEGQMLPGVPRHRYVALYWTQDDAAASTAWETAALGESELIDPASLCISRWHRLTHRLTIDDVRHTSADDLAAEERARRHLKRAGATGRAALGLVQP
jgi:hypothetical protein